MDDNLPLLLYNYTCPINRGLHEPARIKGIKKESGQLDNMDFLINFSRRNCSLHNLLLFLPA